MKIFNIKEVFLHNTEDTRITCPICSCINTHLYRADIVDGKDKYQARSEFRQDVAIIKMYCEQNDHYFKIGVGEHKGECFLFYETD